MPYLPDVLPGRDFEAVDTSVLIIEPNSGEVKYMSSLPAQSNFKIKENSAKWLGWLLVLILVFTGIGLRYASLGYRSLDMNDAVLPWFKEFVRHGHKVLSESFSVYTPPYLYLLYVMSKTTDIFRRIVAIKLISISFDFLNAFLVYKILKMRYPQGAMALIGASAFLVLPAVLLNSAYWGQADSIYAFFALACVFFLMRNQPLLAMISWGISFSFKAQAAFLGPFILLLIVKKKVPWYYLWIVPLMYALMMTPAALTGRPVIELLTIYFGQAINFRELSKHAPNFYLFIPNSFYESGVILGLAVTILIALAWTAVYAGKIKEVTPETILLCALASAAFMPFFLPKMHDRYFYLAEVLSFIVAFYFLKGWYLALGYQIVAGLVYWVFLHSNIKHIETPLELAMLYLAAVINTILLASVFWMQWKLIGRNAEKPISV
jgi:Gpi18-like mannosyltransferase